MQSIVDRLNRYKEAVNSRDPWSQAECRLILNLMVRTSFSEDYGFVNTAQEALANVQRNFSVRDSRGGAPCDAWKLPEVQQLYKCYTFKVLRYLEKETGIPVGTQLALTANLELAGFNRQIKTLQHQLTTIECELRHLANKVNS